MKSKIIAVLMFGSCAFYAAQDVGAIPTISRVLLRATVPSAFNADLSKALLAAGQEVVSGASDMPERNLLTDDGKLADIDKRSISIQGLTCTKTSLKVSGSDGRFVLKGLEGAELPYEVKCHSGEKAKEMKCGKAETIDIMGGKLSIEFAPTLGENLGNKDRITYEDVVTLEFSAAE